MDSVAPSFYHAHRGTGTLMCHYRHYAHTDPFYLPRASGYNRACGFHQLALAGRLPKRGRAGADQLHPAPGAVFFYCRRAVANGGLDPADASTYLLITDQAQRLFMQQKWVNF
jgi:hypothetical protein